MPKKSKNFQASKIKIKCPKCLHQFLSDDIRIILNDQQRLITQLRNCLKRKQFEMELMQKAFTDIRQILTNNLIYQVNHSSEDELFSDEEDHQTNETNDFDINKLQMNMHTFQNTQNTDNPMELIDDEDERNQTSTEECVRLNREDEEESEETNEKIDLEKSFSSFENNQMNHLNDYNNNDTNEKEIPIHPFQTNDECEEIEEIKEINNLLEKFPHSQCQQLISSIDTTNTNNSLNSNYSLTNSLSHSLQNSKQEDKQRKISPKPQPIKSDHQSLEETKDTTKRTNRERKLASKNKLYSLTELLIDILKELFQTTTHFEERRKTKPSIITPIHIEYIECQSEKHNFIKNFNNYVQQKGYSAKIINENKSHLQIIFLLEELENFGCEITYEKEKKNRQNKVNFRYPVKIVFPYGLKYKGENIIYQGALMMLMKQFNRNNEF